MVKRKMNSDQKIERVLNAARSLFVEKGYYGVSIPKIVEKSGVSTGAIYNYFENKNALAKTIHDQTLNEFHSLFQQRLTGDESVFEVLRIFAELVCTLTESNPVMMEYMLFLKHDEFLVDSPPICFTEPFRLLQEYLKKGIEQGEVRGDDYMIAGLTFTGVVLRAAELRLARVLKMPLPEICDLLVESGWDAIKAK